MEETSSCSCPPNDDDDCDYIQWIPTKEEIEELSQKLYTGVSLFFPGTQQLIIPPTDTYIGPDSFKGTGLDSLLIKACLTYNTDVYSLLLPFYLQYYHIDTKIQYISHEESMDFANTLPPGSDICLHDHPQFLKSLIREMTLLHAAAEAGTTDTLTNFVIFKGANINVRDCCLRTPFLIAIINGRYETACAIMNIKKSQLEIKDINGMTPLMHLARTAHSKSGLDCLKKLLETGINYFAIDYYNFTAFHHAAMEGNSSTLRILFQHVPYVNGSLSINQRGPKIYEVADTKLIIYDRRLQFSPLIPDYPLERAKALFLSATHFCIANRYSEAIDYIKKGIAVCQNHPRIFKYIKPGPRGMFFYKTIPNSVSEMTQLMSRSRDYKLHLTALSLAIKEKLDSHCSVEHIKALFSFSDRFIKTNYSIQMNFERAMNLIERGFELINYKCEERCHFYEWPHVGQSVICGLICLENSVSQLQERLLLINAIDIGFVESKVSLFLSQCLRTSIQYLCMHSTLMKSKHVHIPKMLIVSDVMNAILRLLGKIFDLQNAWKIEMAVFEMVQDSLIKLCDKVFDGGAFFENFLHKFVSMSTSILSFSTSCYMLKELLENGADEYVNALDQYGRRLLYRSPPALKSILLHHGAHVDCANMCQSSKECYRLYISKKEPLSLQCLCSQVIAEECGLDVYSALLPPKMIALVKLHDSKNIEHELL